MTTTYTIKTRDGRTVTRRSEARYVAASVRGTTVRFHQTHEAAERAAGSGYVVPIESDARPATTEPPEVWTVFYADGETREVEVTRQVPPIKAGREIRPEAKVVRATRKRA